MNEAAATWLDGETCTPAHAISFRSNGERLPQLGDDSQSRRSVPLICESEIRMEVKTESNTLCHTHYNAPLRLQMQPWLSTW